MRIGFNVNQTKQQKQLQIPIDFRHCLILGATGSGKTASVITPILLERMKNGHGILIFDFKGNYHYIVKALAKKYNKLHDVIELGRDYGKFINLLEDLPVESLDKIFKPILGHNEKDKFWENSAIQLAISILAIIKYMRELTDNYKHSYSIKSLIEIAGKAEKLKKFKKETLYIINKILNNSNDSLEELILIKIIAKYYKMLDNVADDSSLEKMINENEKTILTSIIGSLINPIASLIKENINIDEIDILEELSKRKIIIVSLNDFEENTLNIIVSSIFSKIHLFKMSYSDFPLTIIMDEAQKVLNNYFPLPLDTLREYQTEVILATQSIDNLREGLDSKKVEAYLANLVHKIYLNGKDMELQKFEAFYNGSYYQLTPIEVSNIEKFLVEKEFQKKYSKLKHLPFKYKGQDVIYSKFSETKLIVKDNNLKAIGKVDFILKHITKKELCDLFPDILKLKDEINQSRAIEEYLRNESHKGDDYDYY